ncbi:TPA: flagellar basal body P-ring protein FlgI [Salmonella enterica subsp. enterica serovar Muenchen]|nr:flagellar basal body P-ring protein FlgI [Salmonella enterica subsp. enterica serovar Muenchen]HEC8860532.1 flagellar basal body P-ring protein FlgI [Salmonella enterica subsp. enterica serovar Muenchen]
MNRHLLSCFGRILVVISLSFLSPILHAERIRDLTTLSGVRGNSLMGYGLVVGLDGTGDQTMQTPFTTQTLNNMLSQLGITVPAGVNMQLKNVAAVMVTAELPPFARAGEKIDVVVSSMGNARSLRGGTLLMTPLKGVDNQIYALAQGNLLVSGAGAKSRGASVQVNQLNGARITDGATVEREVPMMFNEQNILKLLLNQGDFTVAQEISDAINRRFNSVAVAEDSRTVRLYAPVDKTSRIRFLATILDIPIRVGSGDARVVINSRTGSVVINRHVVLEACAVAQGELSVDISPDTRISQPDTPLAGGQTVVSQDSRISVRNKGGVLQQMKTSADLNSVIRALNSLGATPNDLMAILQAMKSAGCLHARLEMN